MDAPSQPNRTAWLLTAAIAWLAPSDAQAQARAGEDLVREVLPYVVTLRSFDGGGSEISLGSGFSLRDGRIVTNSHVVEGASWVEVYGNDGRLLATEPYLEAVSTSQDLAILPSVNALAGGLSLSNVPVQPGQKIWVIGAPAGLSGSVSDGVVSAVREVGRQELIQITAPISSGSSGGPVIDEQGFVVGVAVAIVEAGQNLNFAVPATSLRALADSPPAHLPFPVPQASRAEANERTDSQDGEVAANLALLLTAREFDPNIGVFDSLTTGDTEADGRYFDHYYYAADEGEAWDLNLVADFDAVLLVTALEDFPDGWRLEDDDSGEGTDSRLVFQFPADGAYYIIATSYVEQRTEAPATGMYALFLGSEDSTLGAAEGLDRNRWTLASTNTDGDEWWIDTETLMRLSGGMIRAWSRTFYVDPQTNTFGATYDEARLLWEWDCNRRRSRMLSIIQYLEGQVVDSDEISLPEWSNVVPESVGENILEEVCRR